MELTKETKQKLLVGMGDVLVKVVNDEFSTQELDKILTMLLEQLGSLDNIDKNIIKEMVKIESIHKDRLSKQNLEKLISLRQNNEDKKQVLDEETQKRLYEHFEQEFIYEHTRQKKIDESLEIQTKHLVPDKKIYFEEQKVLLTMLTSNICTQDETDRIKELIENGDSFTQSIKSVIKGKSELTRVQELCKLQDERFKLDEETQKRLY